MPGGLSRWFGRVRVLHDGRLEASPEAGTFFDSLAQFYRKAYLRWIDGTKRRPDVRARRIALPVVVLALLVAAFT